MSQKMTMRFLRLIVCALLVGAATTFAQTSAPTPAAPVLPLIEKYKAPPYRASGFLDRETYDYRIKFHEPLPATLTDVLICDVWQRVTMDLKLKVTPKDASAEIVKQALNVYLTKRWDDIAGYRPWTHWNFVRGLKPPQRE